MTIKLQKEIIQLLKGCEKYIPPGDEFEHTLKAMIERLEADIIHRRDKKRTYKATQDAL